MLTSEQIRKSMDNVLKETDFKIKDAKKYVGKVRDNYILKDKRIIITTDRISCFDKVIGALPFKGQILNQMADFWFKKTRSIVPNHIIDIPDPNVMVVKECRPFPVEVIVRGYITGSLWREYEKGTRDIYGIKFENNLIKNQKFDTPIITPTTKAGHGEHDMPLSEEEILKKGLVPKDTWEKLKDLSLRLFQKGTEIAGENNLILVDTKYEFGELNGKIVLMDEIHTPDSSRFWYADSYASLFNDGKPQKQLDKEFVRQWLIKKAWTGDSPMPKIPEDIKVQAVERYIEVFETVTGKEFETREEQIHNRIETNLKNKGYL